MKLRQSRGVGVGYPLRQNLLVGFVKITLVTLVVVGGPDPWTSPASYAPQHTDDDAARPPANLTLTLSPTASSVVFFHCYLVPYPQSDVDDDERKCFSNKIYVKIRNIKQTEEILSNSTRKLLQNADCSLRKKLLCHLL